MTTQNRQKSNAKKKKKTKKLKYDNKVIAYLESKRSACTEHCTKYSDKVLTYTKQAISTQRYFYYSTFILLVRGDHCVDDC